MNTIRWVEFAQGFQPELTPEEMADMLWLAGHIDVSTSSTGHIEPPIFPLDSTTFPKPKMEAPAQPPMSHDIPTSQPSTVTEAQIGNTSTEATADLYPLQATSLGETGVGVLPYRSPAGRALPAALALGRSLRPLKRRVASNKDVVLDENATAEGIAHTGEWLPVLKPAPERWLDLVLVVDESSNMVIWERTIAALQTLLVRLGAFREIQTWGIRPEGNGDEISFYRGSGAFANRSPRRPAEVVEQRQRRLILVISDCASSAWYSGAMSVLLQKWGERELVAILQVLPRRLWTQTALQHHVAVYLRAPLPGTVNRKLKVQWQSAEDRKYYEAGIPVPVLLPDPDWLNLWAHSLAGNSRLWIPGTVLINHDWREAQPNIEIGTTQRSARELVSHFQSASALARQLATYFTAVPLTLPIMRLVQNALLPNSSHLHLAEIFMSGLLHPITRESDTTLSTEEAEYEFVSPEVRDLVANNLRVDETINLLQIISTYIGTRSGQPLDFGALLADPTRIGPLQLSEKNRRFAQVAAPVLRRFGGEYVQLAQRLEASLYRANVDEQEMQARKHFSPQEQDSITLQEHMATQPVSTAPDSSGAATTQALPDVLSGRTDVWQWSRFAAQIVEQARKLLGDAGRQAYEKISWHHAAERYRQEMRMLYGTMPIIGMSEPVALTNIFTDIFLLDKPSAWRRYNIEELKSQQSLSYQDVVRTERHGVLDMVRQFQRLLILGRPGAGKTTLLKHLVLQATEGKLNAVPIFVGLKAWADSGLELVPFMGQQFAICAFPDTQPFIHHILSEGWALLLFDGLDEVNLEQGSRERIIREVQDIANQYPRSPCVITFRTASSEYQFEGFHYCELADFTEDQIRTFVAQWFQQDETKRAAFFVEFARAADNRLRDLARTPLLLTLLCLTFDETMNFPLRRAEIYEEATDALLRKWDASRNIKRDTIYRTLSLGHKRQILARIAAATFEKNEIFIRQEDLEAQVVSYLRGLPSADDKEDIDGEAILRSIEAQHGLLVERAYRIYSFSHLVFHEYFTARYIVEHPSRRMFGSVVNHAYDARWREVLLLIASMLDDANAEIFFAAFVTALHTIIDNDKSLAKLQQWVTRKADPQKGLQSYSIRMSYLVLALSLIPASPSAAPELDRVKTKARTLAPSFQLIFDLSPRQGQPNKANQTYINDPLLPDIVRADFQKTSILLWAEGLSKQVVVSQVDDYDDQLRVWRSLTDNTTLSLDTELNTLVFPRRDSSSEEWLRFFTQLHSNLRTHLAIEEIGMLDHDQIAKMDNYLMMTNCLLECLDLAAVPDRTAIRNHVLSPLPVE